MPVKRVFLIVLDSFGVGALPDAADFGDVGAYTLGAVMRSEKFNVPVMKSLGLFNIDGIGGGVTSPLAAYGRAAERSKGKDTVIGHWELCGVVSERALPTYKNGFPTEIIERFKRITGRDVLCNKPYSGTEVIKDYGQRHIETGALIVYTSADSVFQVAAHEEVVPLADLYAYCAAAREMLVGEHGVGRVIARPFTGSNGSFTRTANRHDYALKPPAKTALDYIKAAGKSVLAIGKINDIFAGEGITEYAKTTGNADGMCKTYQALESDLDGLCFTNLVDFDQQYGHRRDIDGYAAALTEFDAWLGGFIKRLRDDDVLVITADHGCDPSYTAHTDHTREYIPLLVYGTSVRPRNLGTLESFADIGKSVSELLGVDCPTYGKSFV